MQIQYGKNNFVNLFLVSYIPQVTINETFYLHAYTIYHLTLRNFSPNFALTLKPFFIFLCFKYDALKQKCYSLCHT